MPVVLDGRAENTNFVANRLAAAEGQWFIPDKLLAEIWDAEVKEVNLIADRQSVVGQKIRQVIEIPCNLSSIKDRPQGGQGQANRFYSLDQALQLTTNRTVFADGWSRDSALSALRYGYEYRQANGEPNPFRRRLVQTREQLNKIAVEKAETINGQREAKDRLRQLTENIRTLKADEHELGLVRSAAARLGLFTADELMRLGELTAATRQAREEAESRRRLHELEHVRLNAKREAYESFKATHPDRSPEDGSGPAMRHCSCNIYWGVGTFGRNDAT